jgi:tetratricopeptide (TPR) repeat protein
MRNVLWIGLCLGGLAAAVVGARSLRARQDAQALTREATLALHASFERAPELSRLAATRALQLLERSLELHEIGEARGLLDYARALEELQKGRLEQAARALQRAERARPHDADVSVLAAALARAQGRSPDAFARVRSVLARDPQHGRARVLACDLALDAGDANAALALLEPLLRKHGKIGALYGRRGLAREALGQDRAALADFTRASELDGSLLEPLINRGRLLSKAGRARDAEHAFAQALDRSQEPDAWLGRGLARVALGDLAGGRTDIEQARERAPAQPEPLLALADLDARELDLGSAITRYRAALALDPSLAVAWLKLGNALTRKRQLNDARDAFQRALVLDPGLGAAHNGLGAALMALGHDDAAEQALATAAALDKDDPNPLLNLALLRTRHGDRRGAEDARAQAALRAN